MKVNKFAIGTDNHGKKFRRQNTDLAKYPLRKKIYRAKYSVGKKDLTHLT
jgi:hypothetical protein